MGIGAAIGAIGGAMSVKSGMDQAKAAKKAANKQGQYVQEGVEAVEKGYEDAFKYMEQSETYLDRSLGLANGFASMMNGLAQEYGQFANEMYKDWEDTFGDIRGNLVDYYQNLDPEKYAVQAKADLARQLDKSMQQFDEAAAQSGIMTSGMRLQKEKENAFKQAEAFAQADLMSEDYVRQRQDQFYGRYGEPQRQQAVAMKANAPMMSANLGSMGLNAQQNALGQYGNYYNNLANLSTLQGRDLSNTYLGVGSQYGKSAANYGKASGNNIGAGLNMLGSSLGSMFGSSDSVLGMF